jgi:hypothetical protein
MDRIEAVPNRFTQFAIDCVEAFYSYGSKESLKPHDLAIYQGIEAKLVIRIDCF